MPAYSFQPRFVPFVENETKGCTIRNFRKYKFRKGQTAHLYSGLRTKYCRKLKEKALLEVYCIAIFPNGTIWLLETEWLTEAQREAVKKKQRPAGIKVRTLDVTQKSYLAWLDGFRPEGDTSIGSFEVFMRYWKQNNPMPFVGCLSIWGEQVKQLTDQIFNQ